MGQLDEDDAGSRSGADFNSTSGLRWLQFSPPLGQANRELVDIFVEITDDAQYLHLG